MNNLNKNNNSSSGSIIHDPQTKKVILNLAKVHTYNGKLEK